MCLLLLIKNRCDRLLAGSLGVADGGMGVLGGPHPKNAAPSR